MEIIIEVICEVGEAWLWLFLLLMMHLFNKYVYKK